MSRELYWLWLQHALGVGAPQAALLLGAFGGIEAIYAAEDYPFDELSPLQRKHLADKRLGTASSRLRAAQKVGAWIMTPDDEVYDLLFEGMYAPPAALYCKGEVQTLTDRPLIAVVGTRSCDEDGRRVTRRLCAGLAAGGAGIVSGGAVGIDSEALSAALDEHGVCLSFQACGIDVDYPKATAPLRERIVQNGGMILSEFPPGLSAYRHHFRIRNRLISAAGRGTLVTQAPLKSGALITASWAREQGRDVFAVPGRVGTPANEGSNALLKDGAYFVTGAEDILTHYLMRYPFTIDIAAAVAAEQRAAEHCDDDIARSYEQAIERPPTLTRVAQPTPKARVASCPDGVSDTAKAVYAALEDAVKTVTELSRELEISPSAVMAALTVLELHRTVCCTAGQHYALREIE